MKIRDLFEVMANSTMVSISKTVVTSPLYYGEVWDCPKDLLEEGIFLILPINDDKDAFLKIAIEPTH